MRCPLSYYLGRVLKLDKSPAAWLIQGTAVHAAIESYEKSLRQATEATCLDVFESVWNVEEEKAWKQEPNPIAWQKSGVRKTETDLSIRKEKGAEQVLAYIEYAQKENLEVWKLPDTGEPASEVPFEEDFGGVTVRGFIDLIMVERVTDNILVRDIKTGTKVPVGNFQLATYRHAVKKKYGKDALWGDYWMAKDSKPTPAEPVGLVTETMITTQFQIMDAAERNGQYGANIGDHCGRCDVARHCPFVGGQPPEGIPALGT
jgi:putative RecB family exonuclease